MMSIVCLDIGKERHYLRSTFPVNWSIYVSEARTYQNEEEARFQLNARFVHISSSLGDSMDYIRSIRILTYEGEKLISDNYYLKREE